MQRYLEQLYSDIENVLNGIRKDALNHPEFDFVDYGDSTQIITSIQERQKLSQLTGLQKKIFPTTDQLTLCQKNNLGRRLEELLWSCNFIIVVPICFTHAERYSFIREIWNVPYPINKGGLYIAELYSNHLLK